MKSPASSALVLALLMGSGGARAADETLEPCRIAGLKHEVLCGSVDRALDPARPEGARIAVHYAVVPAPARGKRGDPIFFFAGGPGQSAIALAPTFAATVARLAYRRDLVFVDQRGTGRSAPLACAEDDRAAEARRPIAERIDVARGIARLAACMQGLQKLPHGDLRHYTTTIAMADVEAVRAALGAERINLVGGSYGTRAVLEYLRQQPQRVRRAVIDGVAPPDMALAENLGLDTAAALQALIDGCGRDAACARRHPRLAAHWAALMKAPSSPAQVLDPASGRLTTVAFTPELVAAMVRGPLYAPALAAALPFAIDEAAAGRWQPLAGLATAAGGGARATRIAEGMHFSVICAEDAAASGGEPPPRPALAGVETLLAAYARPYRELCASWPRGAVPAEFRRIAPSPAPVLLLSGGLDPVTPPRHGQRVAEALGPQARHAVAPNAGHGLLNSGCGGDLLHGFVEAETDAQALSVDARCLARLPRPPAYVPPGLDAGDALTRPAGARP
ncbi:MAG TPA: alpha/beta hydrolase [Methylibium sp.]|uniref:alpha/beta hydrolase n=1 Tax=Methylibium sp. TaxID=2067992 RepID=UPI002DB75EE4|nr:alpha/beta hydrolase [Methylibium sp.]HEU4459500.1 alpha/beta hydrolase [Methylibium sp.]